MSLRKQLAIFSLLSLVLPWAGYRYVREMETVLREGLERSLLERAATVAGALERQAWTDELSEAFPNSSGAGQPVSDIYTPVLTAAPLIDGSRADWSIDERFAAEVSPSVRYWTGTYGSSLFVIIDVRDEDVVFQARPGEPPYGDRLVVRTGLGAADWRVLATAAPGLVRAQETSSPLLAASGSYDDRIQAAWLATPDGYSIELRLPLAMMHGALGLGVVDVDSLQEAVEADSVTRGYGVNLTATWDDASDAAANLVLQSAGLGAALLQYADSQNRYSVIDNRGWVRATAGSIAGGAMAAQSRSLTSDLLRYLLQTDDPEYARLEVLPGRISDTSISNSGTQPFVNWYRGDFDDSSRVVAGVSLFSGGMRVGQLLLEQASDSVLTATNQAVIRLLSTTFIASLAALVGMIGFASWLSIRVSRLAKAAEQALGPRGQIETRLPGHAAGDEIGALARSFERLLERLNEYTSYLRTLTSKLSHELRTPLAVVSTSLDNLEQAEEEEARRYLIRLREGANRLDAILGAMSEATRMEQAIRDASAAVFEAGAVVESCARAYADVYSNHEIRLTGLPKEQFVRGSPELLAQLLDKLVDNAAGFSPPGAPIDIAATATTEKLTVTVANQGPQLPPQMREQLFDSLVSVRDEHGGEPHLGLGLYIARLIAEFHGGDIDARNLAHGSGVEFAIRLPKVGSPGAS